MDNIAKIYFDKFFEVTYEIEKNVTSVSRASVHLENGPLVKNSSKSLN